MIEPYGKAIKAVEPELSRLGYFKTSGDEYAVTFSEGSHKIEIVTERYDPPSETIFFITPSSKCYCLWILQTVMYPKEFRMERAALQDILKKYGIKEKKNASSSAR